ncbi:MAG: lactate 2-monooxygenase, partial [Glaciecola sp.]
MPDPVDHSAFQIGVYVTGMDGTLPSMPFAYPQWEAAASKVMDARALGYVGGGAGLERTMAQNTRAFDRWQFVPRVMRDVSVRDTRVELFGTQLPSPMLVAPIGVQSIIHPEGELATARAAASLDVPMIASTAASHTLEQVAEASGEGPRWFQ